MKPRYIAHTGKKQPVDDGTIVDVVFPDRMVVKRKDASHWRAFGQDWWIHSDTPLPNDRIIAYRVIEQE
jgi:hypothetical protein